MDKADQNRPISLKPNTGKSGMELKQSGKGPALYCNLNADANRCVWDWLVCEEGESHRCVWLSWLKVWPSDMNQSNAVSLKLFYIWLKSGHFPPKVCCSSPVGMEQEQTAISVSGIFLSGSLSLAPSSSTHLSAPIVFQSAPRISLPPFKQFSFRFPSTSVYWIIDRDRQKIRPRASNVVETNLDSVQKVGKRKGVVSSSSVQAQSEFHIRMSPKQQLLLQFSKGNFPQHSTEHTHTHTHTKTCTHTYTYAHTHRRPAFNEWDEEGGREWQYGEDGAGKHKVLIFMGENLCGNDRQTHCQAWALKRNKEEQWKPLQWCNRVTEEDSDEGGGGITRVPNTHACTGVHTDTSLDLYLCKDLHRCKTITLT